MAEYGSMTPMSVGDPATLWKGGIKTNGFLMGNVNGRVPALTEGFSSILIDPANPLYTPDVITWGNGLWRDINEIDTRPGTLHAQAPSAKPALFGVLEFNQGWQASNPVQPYGMPSYSLGTIIRDGLVGYETAMTDIGQTANYLKYLQGDSAQDIPATRTLFADWMAAWKAAAAGSKLAIFYEDSTGFPIVSAVLAANLANPTLSGATFGGFIKVIAKEHERAYFDIQL
jgi:hypothetical protein